ncbi:DUF1593 domain-containing protein [Blastopirellula sp. JC732]|uniref:DUF1593 domain-containing protein n=1 Tax=Blastopirellula sediminis TaxID=2894196 RepID=A0A9X1SEG4_9BACT|nr:nucleoside hydrolase-like domain-containing protein [Blastopirellula sediminis]MCC9609388.1 DUF1593 domain-containing protein [Blastopirellula sediminis]MCC9627835.1 DUF1593 domain-containing protein [Blastopirellula sediminis]
MPRSLHVIHLALASVVLLSLACQRESPDPPIVDDDASETHAAATKDLSSPIVDRPRVIVTTDGEADDRCSMVRFLLTCNEFEVEAIVNSSSQFHWEGGEGWNAFHPVAWVDEYIDLYAQVYDNLLLHDPNYPSPEYLKSRWKVGNISAIGEDEIRTEGAEFIANILLDDSDPRPIWIQAWGGCNTIARALRIIQEEHPSRMKEVAGKLRLFLIWEQDETYQSYIRPNWEQFEIPTIISDQFDCMAYIWPKVLPEETKRYFEAEWMGQHILNDHGPLCAAYEAKEGAFQAEGDTPAFLHAIPNGLRSVDSPDWGGWGGRHVRVRNNVWMDPPPADDWKHPEGRWHFGNSWSKKLENVADLPEQQMRTQYFKPIWRWLAPVQNDFAARADWCVKDYAAANHPPVVQLLDTPLALKASPGQEVTLDATSTIDPDGDALSFRWWNYVEAGTYPGKQLDESSSSRTKITIPHDAQPGEEIHMICEATDAGSPPLTRYQRVVIRVESP